MYGFQRLLDPSGTRLFCETHKAISTKTAPCVRLRRDKRIMSPFLDFLHGVAFRCKITNSLFSINRYDPSSSCNELQVVADIHRMNSHQDSHQGELTALRNSQVGPRLRTAAVVGSIGVAIRKDGRDREYLVDLQAVRSTTVPTKN
jgi:hypothetical protein